MRDQIAQLPMYDWPEVRAATDALWAKIHTALQKRSVGSPDTLDREKSRDTTWLSPQLLLSQTCGLPLVQKFADWAGEHHADDIVVYAVNVWERGSSQSAIDQMVEAFWTKNKFTMPTLISYSRKITQDYGVTGIPVTVMIDRDGKVAKQHRGYSPALFDQLKAEAETLLNAKP